MKKKIAFFANGWSGDIILNYLNGLMNSLPKDSVDIFMFLGHARYSDNEAMAGCEASIYDLPNVSDFDAAIIFGSSLNLTEIQEHVYSVCINSGIPVISIGFFHEGCINIMSDNRTGMEALCDHLLNEHDVKSVLYVAGNKDHPDSILRQTIVSEAMHKRGLSFSEEDVLYSNWEPNRLVNYIHETYVNRSRLVDAIICANDLLATAAINALFEIEVSVPDDIIVTGFDNDYDGQIYSPSLSTVDPNHYEMGVKTAELLDGILNGTNYLHNSAVVVPSIFEISESCCLGTCKASLARELFLKNMPRSKEIEAVRKIRIHEIEWAISRSEKIENLSPLLKQLLNPISWSEGDSFHILIDPAFGNSDNFIYNDCNYVFPEEMDVVVSKEDGVPSSEKSLKTANLIPGYTGTGSNHVYTFMALYPEELTCGYMVMRDNINYLQKNIFRDFSETITRSLESCLKNIQLNILNERLSELMQQDALTLVKNRIAYEKYLEQAADNQANHKDDDFAVIMFDINNLKTINDKFGHETGDLYIKNCCNLICDFFKRSPIFRIGGDEFVAILHNADYVNRDELMAAFRAKLDSLQSDSLNVRERLSIASGMAEYNKGSGENIKDVIKRADTLMYENKKLMKSIQISKGH